MISKDHSKLSVIRQCKLLELHRSGIYYKPKQESILNLELMRLMDAHYTEHPFKGAPGMHTWLTMDKGYKVNHKRIERLYYNVMGLQAIMPGKHTSRRHRAHKVYPYLLRNLKVERADQVWATDITYIPMRKGFMYLTAIIDLHSRYVLNWSVSNTMDATWCAQVLEETIQTHGTPEIINTDQGSQYTSEIFTKTVFDYNIKLSMDGKGRAIDNVFIERLWRSVKYEEVYLNPPDSARGLYRQLDTYFRYYNNQRRHQGINNQIPFKRYLIKQKRTAA